MKHDNVNTNTALTFYKPDRSLIPAGRPKPSSDAASFVTKYFCNETDYKSHANSWSEMERLSAADSVYIVTSKKEAAELRDQGLNKVFSASHITTLSFFTRVKKVTVLAQPDAQSRKWAFQLARNISVWESECRAIVEVWDHNKRCIFSSEWIPAITGRSVKSSLRERYSFDIDGQPCAVLEWAWDGVLLKGGTALLSGQPKAGKTVAALALAARAAQGQTFLGRDTSAQNVIYVSFEGNRNLMRQQLDMLGGEEVTLIHKPSPLTPEDGIEALLELVVAAQPNLVLIDTLQGLLPGVELIDGIHGYKEVSRYLGRLAWLARYTGTALLFVHHNGKSDSLLGTQALAGGVDTVLNLSKSREISSVQRAGSQLPKTKIRFDQENFRLLDGDPKGLIGSGRSYCHGVFLAALALHQEPVAAYKLNVAGGYTNSERKVILDELVDAEKVGRVSRTGKGRPGDLYFLP